MMLSKVSIRKGVPPHSREGDSKWWPHHTACEYLAAPGDQQDPLCSLFIVILSTLFPPYLAALLPLLPIRTPFLGAQWFIFVKGKSQRKECHYKTTMSKWQLYPFSPLLMSEGAEGLLETVSQRKDHLGVSRASRKEEGRDLGKGASNAEGCLGFYKHSPSVLGSEGRQRKRGRRGMQRKGRIYATLKNCNWRISRAFKK